MKTEDGNEGLHPWIEPELEARLTALVLGEASDFERDELERLVAERPELGLYRKRLEAMHRMLREVATGESAEEQGEWKLGAERRTAVLARLRGEGTAEEKVVVMPRSKRRLPWGMMIRIAACVAVIALFLGLMFPATTGALRKAERPNEGGNAFAYFDSSDTSSRQQWSFREPSPNPSDPQPAATDLPVVTDLGPERFVGAISGSGAISADEFGNDSALRRGSVVTESPATPGLALIEKKEDGLTDLATRTPVATTGTTAPPAEPLAVNRSGQTDISNGTVALGSGSLTINGGIEENSTAGRRLEGEASGYGLKDANTYTGGLVINSGGVAITSPEPAAAPPASAAPVDVKNGYDRIDTMTRGRSATTDSDGDGLDRDGLADSRTGEKAKPQPGQTFAEEERMQSLQALSETTGTPAAADAPAGGGRELPKKGHGQVVPITMAEKEVAELAPGEALKAMPESEEKPVIAQEKFKLDVSNGDLAPREMPRKAGKADDFGTVNVGQTGAAAVPAPAAAVPMPVAAATASDPAVADPETPLTKLGAGTLALNGGTVDLSLSEEMVEVDGFIDHKTKTNAPKSAPSAGGNLNFTGDLQVNGGVEAKGNAAKETLSLGSGGMIAGVSGQEGREGFGNEPPAKLDALSRSTGSGVASGQEGDVSRMGRSGAVEKSLSQATELEVKREGTGDWGKAPVGKAPTDETVDLGGEISAGYMSDYIFHGTRFQADGKNMAVPTPGTVNFDTAVSQIENPEEFQKTGDANVALPGLQSDKRKFRFTVQAGSQRTDAEVEIDEPWRLGRAAEVEKSVEDIMALTSQLDTQTNAGVTAWYGSANSSVPAVDKNRFATFYDVGEVTDGPATSAGDSDTNHYFATASDPNGGFNVRYRPTPIDPADPTRSIYSSVLREAPKPTPAALDETSPSAEPFSTFSLHVSDVSFQLAKSSLASGKWPEAEKIRIEEFVNAFDYGDPVPSMGERVACRIDQGAHPFLQQRNLVRIALRTAEAGRSSGTPLRLTLLLDSSGSMERPDRRATLTRAVATLTGLLGENDRITLVSFARQPRLVADAVAGNEAMKLAETVASLPSEGGTNLEAALELAFEKAREHQEADAQNRIVLLTDGAANLGDAKAESLGARVEMMRDAGIAFDAAGFGAEGLNDEILEALTRKGDGRYYLLDRPEDAGEAFAEQIAGALRPAAKNVKVQVEFNPDRVKSYKLLGFEKHRLATEDFRNDAVDAAELAAAEAGVAVYQVEPDPAGEGDLGSVSVRFRDLESGEMIERRWSLPHLASAPAADQGGGATHLAIVASQFAAKLAGGPLGDVVDLGELARLAATLPDSPRVDELRTMIEQARGLEGDR